MGRKSRAKRERTSKPEALVLPHTEPVPYHLFEAARVRRFMAEAEEGRWRLRHFTRTEEEYQAKVRQLYFTSDHPAQEIARVVQPGDYISLMRRMTENEKLSAFHEQNGITFERAAAENGLPLDEAMERWMPEANAYIPVMSDTHAEIGEHHHPLNHATGRVLITGLGLGCLPHALLTKPDVTRIDIIDIDPDVIALTGHYLTDPRVHIWRGSAAEPHRIPGFRELPWCWDYAWHDIWSHVSSRNLDEDTAEHGIAYSTLFEMYEPYTDEQAAWAYEMALDMERIHQEAVAEELEFRRKLKAAPFEEQVEMVYNLALASRVRAGENADPFRGGERVPDEFRQMLDPDGGFLEHIRDMLSNPDDPFWVKLDEPPVTREALDHPNAHLEV